MSVALSLLAADRLIGLVVDGVSNRAQAPARQVATAAGLGAPDSAVAATALSPADLAPLLRGHAREDDGAAFALFARLGLSAAAIAKALPEARKIAGA